MDLDEGRRLWRSLGFPEAPRRRGALHGPRPGRRPAHDRPHRGGLPRSGRAGGGRQRNGAVDVAAGRLADRHAQAPDRGPRARRSRPGQSMDVARSGAARPRGAADLRVATPPRRGRGPDAGRHRPGRHASASSSASPTWSASRAPTRRRSTVELAEMIERFGVEHHRRDRRRVGAASSRRSATRCSSWPTTSATPRRSRLPCRTGCAPSTCCRRCASAWRPATVLVRYGDVYGEVVNIAARLPPTRGRTPCSSIATWPRR